MSFKSRYKSLIKFLNVESCYCVRATTPWFALVQDCDTIEAMWTFNTNQSLQINSVSVGTAEIPRQNKIMIKTNSTGKNVSPPEYSTQRPKTWNKEAPTKTL